MANGVEEILNPPENTPESSRQLQSLLANMTYPAKKEEIIAFAQEQAVDEGIISMIDQISDREYLSPEDLSQEIGDQSSLVK